MIARTPEQRDQMDRLAVLIATAFVDMVGFSIILPLIPFYAERLHATPVLVGVVIASYSVAQLVTAPLWGRISDRHGRRPVILAGFGASILAYLVFGVASSLWMLIASRAIQGAGGGITGVAQAYVADTMEPAHRARALGWLSAATSAGVMIGPVIGSQATRLGTWGPGVAAACLCLVSLLVAWRRLPESRPAGAPAAARRPVRHELWDVVRHPGRPVSRLVLVYGVGMLAFTSLTAVLALYLERRFGITERTIGWFFMYVGGLSVVMRLLLLGPIVDRLGEVRAMQLGALALIAGLLLYPMAPSVPVLALVMPLVPVGTALLFPATTSLISAFTARERMGTMMGVAQTFAGLARVAAPLLGTMVFQALGISTPFLLAAAIVGVVSLLAWGVQQPPSPRTGGETA